MPEHRTVTAAAELLPFLFENWPDMKRTRIKQWLETSNYLALARRTTPA